MAIVAATPLLAADWAVLGLYLALLLGTGVWFSRRAARTTDEYFRGTRAMPPWAVAISILATAQSAATFVGVPQSAFAGDLTYLSSNLGGLIAAVVLAVFFIPAFYRLGVATPYGLLETRFGPGARLAASCAYLIGRVLASGARVFVGALPACLALFGDTLPSHMAIVIAAFIAFGIAYTFIGGVSSVIWTDVIQVAVYLGAALATIAVLLARIPAPIGEILSALATPPDGGPSKLTVLRIGLDPSRPGLGFDPSQEFTLLTVVTGFVLLTLASHGMDQDLVQRMLTCRDARRGARSVIGGVLVGVPAVAIFLCVGLLLWVYYARPDIMGAAAPAYAPDSGQAFQTFALREMRGGLAGLFLAGLFAAGPAGINSGLNSMSSTFVGDIYRHARPGRDDRHYLAVGRAGVVGAGLLMGGFALLSIWWFGRGDTKLLPFVLGVMGFAYAGLLGVFLTALFTRRGSTRSVVASLITGFLVVLALEPLVWREWTALSPWTADNLRPIVIAFPWRLVIGAAAAFAVCCLGARRPDPHPSATLTPTLAPTPEVTP